MSDVVTGASSAVVVDNPYMTILNRRIRASKKKVERIIALREKKDLKPAQVELCSRFEVYEGILKELTAIKEQYLQLSPEEAVSLSVPVDDSPVAEKPEEPVLEDVVQESVVVEPQEEKQVEEPMEKEEVVALETVAPVEEAVEAVEAVEVAEVAAVAEDTKVEEEVKVEESGEQKDHKRRNDRARPRDDRRQRGHRFGKNQGIRRNGKNGISKKDQEDGWFIPKKVVHLREQE